MSVRSNRFCVTGWSIVFCTLVLLPGELLAIPSFARQYRMSCSACHSPVPSLNRFGEEFARNGYQLTGAEDSASRVETNDSTLSLMKELPVAVRLDGFMLVQPDETVVTDAELPLAMKLFSSGQIREDISYFFYFLMNEDGDVAGVEDAFLYFNNLFGLPLRITAGQFQVADMVFRRELRPTFEDYRIYGLKPGRSRADLTYDRGMTLNYTIPWQTDISFTVVNGNGIGPASDGFYDSDGDKNFVMRIAQPVSSGLTLGTLGYLGSERQEGATNRIGMVGGDLTISGGRFELLGQLLYRRDSNPFFLAARDSAIKTFGGFAQLRYAPEGDLGRWFLFLLYNADWSDIRELQYRSAAANVSWLVSRNFKLMGEYGYDMENRKHRIALGFMTAF